MRWKTLNTSAVDQGAPRRMRRNLESGACLIAPHARKDPGSTKEDGRSGASARAGEEGVDEDRDRRNERFGRYDEDYDREGLRQRL